MLIGVVSYMKLHFSDPVGRGGAEHLRRKNKQKREGNLPKTGISKLKFYLVRKRLRLRKMKLPSQIQNPLTNLGTLGSKVLQLQILKTKISYKLQNPIRRNLMLIIQRSRKIHLLQG